MSETSKETKHKSKGHIASTAVLCVSVLFCLIVTVTILTRGYVSVFGYSIFRVVTGSMEPTIPVGAAVINKSADIETVKVNDIICFRSKESDHYGVTVTHRVVGIVYDDNNNILLETRGDANFVSDGYYVSEANLIGRVIWYSGKESVVTNIISFMTGITGFLICLVLPILFIAGLILQRAVNNIKKEISRVQQMSELPENKRIQGYETLTIKDYDEIYNSLKKQLLEELDDSAGGSEGTTE